MNDGQCPRKPAPIHDESPASPSGHVLSTLLPVPGLAALRFKCVMQTLNDAK